MHVLTVLPIPFSSALRILFPSQTLRTVLDYLTIVLFLPLKPRL